MSYRLLPIAKEGLPIAGIFCIPALIFFVIHLAIPGLLFLGLSLFTLYFFRDPERIPPAGTNLILSPADGRIVDIRKITSHNEERTQISIFLSIFNVHINRSPISGTIINKQYNPGKFLAAFNDKASLDNEQNIITISNPSLYVSVKQIAGLIARRIVCLANIGDRLEAGQRFGLIRFGSRVDITFPGSCAVKVSTGDVVKGGVTILGEFS